MPTTTTSKAATTLNLDALLSQLRLRGIAVGTVEMQRLQAIFVQSPQLSRAQLRQLLSVMLAKDAKQRDTLNRLFDRLVPLETDEVTPDFIEADQPSDKPQAGSSQPAEPDSEIGETSDTVDKTLRQRLKAFSWRSIEPTTIFYAALALLAFIILLLSLWAWEKTDEVSTHSTSTASGEPPPRPIKEIPPKPGEQPLTLIKTIDHWTAQIESTPIDPWPKLLPWLALLLGSGVAFSWLLRKALQTTRRQPLKPPNIKEGKGRFQVPALNKRAEYHLLSGNQRREMRWGISRYISEQPLNRLDIKASVERSAKAGMPEIRFLQASEEREVWLWQDSSSNNKDLIRLVEEVNHSLQRGNIPVQRGYFRGIPSTVRNVQKEIIWSSRHEYPENAPLVVIFADAESLARQQQHDTAQSNTTLHQLSQWEHLCFVDNSYQPGTLQRLLHAPQITCLLPQEVPHWLAQQGQNLATTVESCSLDSLKQWAIACALPTRMLEEDEIRAVHDAMGLSCAWQFHALERYAVKVGARFDFQAKRVALLNNIGLSTTEPEPAIPEFAARAIGFWQQRNTDIDTALIDAELNSLPNARARVRKWNNTVQQHTLRLDSALLGLWQQPAEAAKALSDLYAEPKLRKQVREQLNLLCCADFDAASEQPSSAQIQLPYRWQSLEAETQRQLLKCGFGGVPDTKVRVRWDNVTRLMLASFASVAIISLGFSGFILMQGSQEPITRLDSPEPPAAERIPNRRKDRYLAATYKSIGSADDSINNQQAIQESHQLTVFWTHKEAQAAQSDIDEDPKAQRWLLGEKATPPRPTLRDGRWPDLSIAVIYGDPKDMTLRRLAAKLLDTGSADQVLLGRGTTLRKHRDALVRQAAPIEHSQWLYVGGDVPNHPERTQGTIIAHWEKPPSVLLDRLNASNAIIEVGNTGRKLFLQAEKGAESDKIIELANNLKLIKLPRGSFQMGNDSDDSEKPIHTVTIDYDLWMGQTEVTFEQYDAYVSGSKQEKPSDEKWGRGTRPVINVSWSDTQEYVNWLTSNNNKGLQCRLPSEAEWEYAARAGTATNYPWGNEASHEQANYGKDDCCDGLAEGRDEWVNTSPVGSFPANQFGLHDMHGNVLEWVQDSWNDNYEGAPTNGGVWKEGGNAGRRVLRGGSWFVSPSFLRSAVRGPSSPVIRNGNFGFRVVCSPPSAR